MKSSLAIFLFLFIWNLSNESLLNKEISIHSKEISFKELCEAIYIKTNIRIYYQESWTKELKISLDSDNISINDILKLALKNSNLNFKELRTSILIYPKDYKFLSDLPEYNEEEDSYKTIDDVINDPNNKYITGRQANTRKTIQIGHKNTNTQRTLSQVKGKIFIKDTKKPAIGATIFIEETKTGSSSDLDGNISLSLMPGKYNAVFECLGLKKERYFFNVLSSGNFSIEMETSSMELDEVIVYGDRQTNITSKDPGLEKISPKAIKEIPMMMGERDLLKASEMLPGIVSIGEGSAGLNVRGGNADQNAFYINKIPIYNTSHVFGFFPIFNSDVIKDFSIYKGYIPTQFGGRLSSVFDIQTRPGNMKKHTFHGGINPVSANLTFEGPLKSEKISFLLNGRSTYSDWLLSKIDDPIISNSSASFYDFASSLHYTGKLSQMCLFGYNSKDKFRLSDINSYEYENTGISLNYRHSFSNNFHGEFALIGSKYNYQTTDKQEELLAYTHQYELKHYEAKVDFKHTLNEKHSLKYGLSLIQYKLNRGEILPYENSIRNSINLGKEQGLEGAIYISDMYDINSWLSVNMGIRYSVFAPTGPKTVYDYNSEYPKSEKYIIDSTSYSKGEFIKYYSSPDIRLTANFKTDDRGSVKVSFNQMQQNLFMLNNAITIAPNTQWKLSDYHIAPSKSNQLSLGVFRNMPKGNWETSVEFFYKSGSNYPEFKDGADFINNQLIETEVLQGKQKSYGIELFLKRSHKKIDGWISYTYSRSMVKVDGLKSWEKINKGEAYPSNFDIPHVLNAVVNYHFNRRVCFSSVVNYQKGRPVTYPVSLYYINESQFIDYSKRNEYRIPDYFRVDLSLTIEGNLKKHKLVHSSWMFSLYNALGRKNPYSVYFKTENGKINSYKYSVIGVPFFTVTWLFKLGNYDAE